MADKVRIGLIGAGGYTKNRMLPGFQSAANCEVTTVANRRRETAEAVAAEFNIANVMDDWRQVIESSEVDAVLIGTPPSTHLEMTLAALEAGKHVLCQTRIATTANDAREMKAAADAAKQRGVRSMLVPPGPFYRGRRFIEHLVRSGYLGRVTHVQAFNMNGSMADPATPLSVGRNELELYGQYNAAQLGLMYDVMIPWTGRATRVMGHRATFVEQRPETPGGPMAKAPYPEEVTVIAETESGAVMLNVMNWAARFAESRIELYGDKGTVVYRQRGDVLLAGQDGDEALKELPIPSEYDSPWLVEEEFVRLVIGEIDEPSFTFDDGIHNMEYLEGAYNSAMQGGWVNIA